MPKIEAFTAIQKTFEGRQIAWPPQSEVLQVTADHVLHLDTKVLNADDTVLAVELEDRGSDQSIFYTRVELHKGNYAWGASINNGNRRPDEPLVHLRYWLHLDGKKFQVDYQCDTNNPDRATAIGASIINPADPKHPQSVTRSTLEAILDNRSDRIPQEINLPLTLMQFLDASTALTPAQIRTCPLVPYKNNKV